LPLGCSRSSSASSPPAASARLEVIDTHTHFYDPSRPIQAGRGRAVPWPAPREVELYRTVLPSDWEREARPLGMTGTVVVEAGTAWLEDNDWILALAERHPAIVGLVGNLSGDVIEAGRSVPIWEDLSRFSAEVTRLSRNPLFRGIRVRGPQVARSRGSRGARARFAALADRGLAVDVLGAPMADVAALAAAMPTLRIVVNHMGGLNLRAPGATAAGSAWAAGIAALAEHRNVYLKVSGLVEAVGKGAPASVDAYRPALDVVWRELGPSRLIYGTNWPVSARSAPMSIVHGLVASYFGARGREALERVFARNAKAAYGYVDRRA
jgi:predicted TIM-barrel fold metal-dependent hydrolase